MSYQKLLTFVDIGVDTKFKNFNTERKTTEFRTLSFVRGRQQLQKKLLTSIYWSVYIRDDRQTIKRGLDRASDQKSEHSRSSEKIQ